MSGYKPTFTLKQLALKTGAVLIGNPDAEISGVNTLNEAGPSDASFLANDRYQEAMKGSSAGVICIDLETFAMSGKNYLVSPNPSLTFQKIAELLLPASQSGFRGIHPTAIIHSSVSLGKNVSIGPYVVIDRDVTIGDHTIISAHVTISYEVTVGTHCLLYPKAIIRERCHLGHRVILQPGSVIGSCGFGYVPDSFGKHQKLEQLGIVSLEDDVEIGANTTIDRSRFKATIIKRGSKIDNLCQIGHNVEIGEDNIIAAQTGIAGSTKTGKYVVLGGQVGIVGHVELSDQVMVASRGGISKSLPKGKYRGSPALPFNEYQRQEVHVRKLDEYVDRIKDLEARLKKLEDTCKT